MNKDQVKGRVEEAKGSIKETTGKVVGNPNLQGQGTIDKAAVNKIPVIDGPVTVPSPDQTATATKFLQDNWAKAIG